MFQFFSDSIDQLDLALDYLSRSDRNLDRFALMLIDNVVELTFNRYAQDIVKESVDSFLKGELKHDPKAIEDARSQNFKRKAKAAHTFGLLEKEISNSILNLHTFRNTSYHRGSRHEGILHSLAVFYFRIACNILKEYKPLSGTQKNTDKISYRTIKYIGRTDLPIFQDKFSNAYSRLDEVAASMGCNLVDDLSTDLENTINSTDRTINNLVKNNHLMIDSDKPTRRDDIIIYVQAWNLSLLHVKKNGFIDDNGISMVSINVEHMSEHVKQIVNNPNLEFNSDPIQEWKKTISQLSNEKNQHEALNIYCSFMKKTEKIRSLLQENEVVHDDSQER